MVSLFDAVKAKIRTMGVEVPLDYRISIDAVGVDLTHVSMVDRHRTG